MCIDGTAIDAADTLPVWYFGCYCWYCVTLAMTALMLKVLVLLVVWYLGAAILERPQLGGNSHLKGKVR